MQNKILSTFGIKVVIALLNFLFTVALSRYLGANGKGEASIIVASVVIILIVCDIIGGASVVYFVPRFNNLKLFLISNGWSVIVCTGVYLFFKTTDLLAESSVLHITGIAFVSSFLSTNLSILLGKEKINANNVLSLLKTAIHILVFMLLIYSSNSRNISSYIYSFYAALLTCTVISTFLVYPYLKKPGPVITNKSVITALAKFGLYNQAGHIMKFLSVRMCFYLISYYSGNTALGIFSNGAALVEVILIITNSFTAILYSRIVNTNNKKDARQLTLHYNKISTIACIAAIVPMALFPSSFYSWLFGPEFTHIKQIIIVQAPGIFFYNTALIIGHYFSGTGKNYINTIGNLAGLLVAVIISLLVIPNYNNLWASIISCCSYIAIAGVILFYFIRETGITIKQLLPEASDLKYIIQQAKNILNKPI